MKHVHGPLILGLCVLAACEPPPPSPTPGAIALPSRGAALVAAVNGGSVQAIDLGTATPAIDFSSQQVCATSPAQTIEVRNIDPAAARQIAFVAVTAPFVLTRIENSAHQEVTPPFSLAAGTSAYFSVAVRPEEPDQFNGSLTLVTDDPAQGLFTINLSGTGTGPRLEFSSSPLILTPGASATVSLENTGDSTLSSLAATIRSPFSAQLGATSLAQNAITSLTVTLPTSAAGTFFSETLTVSSSDPCRPSQKIKVVGALDSAPLLVLSHAPLSFSTTTGSVSAPLPVKVKNHGGARLQVAAPTLEGVSTPSAGTQFAVTPAFGFGLEPGEEHTLNVKFAPTASGSHTAQLKLTSNSTGSPHVADLGGEATAPSRALEATPSQVTFATRGADEPGEVTVPVEIVNTGDVSLNLSASTSAASASNPFSVSPSSIAIAPLQHKLLTVKFNNANLSAGVFNGQLTLRDGAFELAIPLQSTLSSTLFSITPPRLDFTAHELGVSTPQTLEAALNNQSDSPVTVIGATQPGSPFSVDLPGSGLTIPAHGVAPLRITFRPSAPGSFDETLHLQNTPRATAPTLRLVGTALAPVLTVTAPELPFSRQLPYGESSAQSVTLKNEGNMNVSLEQISLGTSGDFSLKTSLPRALGAGQSLALSFSFTPQSVGVKEVRPVFHLKTDAGREISSSLNFWLRGTASGPIADISPTPLAFGSQQVMKTKELQLQVRNQADSLEPLKLTRVELVDVQPSAGAFAIDPISSSETPISPDTARNPPLKVKFTPTVDQNYTGKLRITYSGTDPSVTTSKTIPLTGKGANVLVAHTPESLDFKTIPQTTDTQEITVTNDSEVAIDLETVEILPATATSFTYSIEGWPADTRIASGAKRKIKVFFTPLSSTVSENRTLSVKFTGNPATIIPISLKGKAGLPVATYGQLLHQFTDVAKNTRVTQRNRIKNTGATTLRVYQPIPKEVYPNQVTGFSKPYREPSSGSRVEYDWPVSLDEQEGEMFFDVYFQPQRATPASVTETFLIKSNSNGDPASSVEMEVRGTVTSPVLTTQGPSEFIFTPLLNTESVPQDLTLINSGRAQLGIVSVSLSSEAVPYFCIYSDTQPACGSSLSNITLGHTDRKTVYLKTKAIEDTAQHPGKLIISSNSDSSPNPLMFNLSATAIGALTLTPAVLNFEPCNLLARSQAHPLRLTNSGGESVEVASIQFDPPGDFSHGTLPASPIAPGASADIPLYFSPRSGSAAGHREATGTITLKSGKTFTFDVTGTATTAQLQVSLANPPSGSGGADISSMNFGGVRIGTRSKPVTLMLKNVSPVSPGDPPGDLTITKVSVEGRDKALFPLEVPFTQTTLAAGGSVNVTLYFEPQQLAASSANLVVTSDASEVSQYQVLLSGEGRSSVLELSPYELDFHKTVAGSLAPPKKPVVIKNTSIAPLTITSLGIIEDPARTSPTAQADHFSVLPFTPRELAAGESLSMDVTFLAKAGISSAALLKITSNAPRSPDTGADSTEGLVKLRGEGLSSVFKGLRSSVDFGTLRKVDERWEESAELVEFTNDSSETIHLLPPILEGTRAADFRVTFIEKVGDGPTMEVPSGGRVTMKIEFRPTEAAVSEVSLRLATTAQERAATVSLKGKAVTRFLDVNPMIVAFDPVSTGEKSEPQTITLTNLSDLKARISVLQEPSQAFILDPSALSEELPAGGSVLISVTFSPVAKGLAAEELKLRMQRAETTGRDIETVVAIQLKGEGQELIPEGGGCASSSTGTAPLWMGGLLLVALVVRRRSRSTAP
ncbi:choice-of-anchor D domain-containing protein [Hyalangium minutum]|uniref:Abnormal spindle-like microcephaly-associated protein ASH domain-containing protein n=1 Tax=Hyalangium minutum TaxID=394096 RepID=A0A085W5T5_9BACT|nr:choice-of-anchor D domain-containing protein [Hyalangium minutum]KFE63048.1 hypothetical protein DB31_3107 [Hyalangium minutum]